MNEENKYFVPQLDALVVRFFLSKASKRDLETLYFLYQLALDNKNATITFDIKDIEGISIDYFYNFTTKPNFYRSLTRLENASIIEVIEENGYIIIFFNEETLEELED
ncbi:hypothetical protein VIBNISFn27_590003 [Vibrio nigripulchritudo SFn27]|uniref:hypothetical protein n=1 Tax=Vibrio nigripulchritudo TaxID=28173 RepID=UPI0003B17BCD|nr:hypothetical protein [Vibrio nigripulchritudo]CCN89232.1 hypothetical protein VIBNISFn27_590003 [Vibrio nigripulchritudo SFn27]CCO41716.1 hypothetical protein VIBNISFn135_590017 [Vibrio nigripulchritudo SFn135]